MAQHAPDVVPESLRYRDGQYRAILARGCGHLGAHQAQPHPRIAGDTPTVVRGVDADRRRGPDHDGA